MPIKRSTRFRARPSKASRRLVVLPIKWPSSTRTTTPITNDEAVDTPSSARRATLFTSPPANISSPPPVRRSDLSPISTHTQPVRPTNNPDDRILRPQISREERNLLTSFIRAVFSPSTDLAAFISSLEDAHISEAVKLLGYLHKVELEKQAHHYGHTPPQQRLSEGKFVEGVDEREGGEARAYLCALGRKIRALAEGNDRLQSVIGLGQEKERKKVYWDVEGQVEVKD